MMQRSLLGRLGSLVLLLGSISAVAACSDDPQSKSRQNAGGPNGTSGSSGGAGSSGGSGATAVTCPGDIAAPTTLAPDTDASDLRVIGDFVFFRSGTKLVRIKKDGTGRADVYSSPDVVRLFTDGKVFVAVESPDPPDAVIRVGNLGEAPSAEIGTNQNAASVEVFGADDKAAYAVADQANGDVLYRIGRGNGDGGFDPIAETNGVVSDAQVVNGTIWYVKDQKEIYKLTPGDNATPTLVFTAEKGCSLAVGATHLFCSAEGTLEQRDLSGANPKALFSEKTSKVPAAYGASQASGDVVVSMSVGADTTALKNVLRTVSATGEEKVIACGRDQIASVAVDGASVAWIEKGKGVFLAK